MLIPCSLPHNLDFRPIILTFSLHFDAVLAHNRPKENWFSCHFMKKEEQNRPLEIIVAKKTTEFVLLFHKKTTNLIFLWPNISQKSIKVLTYIYINILERLSDIL